jgi:[acyl-carrier-protein] S-malonyltransferase
MASAPGEGGMIAVACTSDTAREEVLDYAERESLDIAAHNGPRQVVLAGARAAVERAEERFGARTRILPVSHGFHSRLMDPVLDRWSEAVDAVPLDSPGAALISCVDGKSISSVSELRDDLFRGLRQPVRWDLVVTEMASAETVIGFGPAAALVKMTRPAGAAIRHSLGGYEEIMAWKATDDD